MKALLDKGAELLKKAVALDQEIKTRRKNTPMAARFGIGDEVTLRGSVRLVDAGGPGTLTIELRSNGQRVTVLASSSFVELVQKAKGGMGFTKAPKGLK